jgi:hypothetical protein
MVHHEGTKATKFGATECSFVLFVPWWCKDLVHCHRNMFASQVKNGELDGIHTL